MADKTKPSRSANMETAEGNRSTLDQLDQNVQNVQNVPGSESNSGAGYDDDGDNAGGITNRPLDEELENQQALPQRGRSQSEERSRSSKDVER